MSYKFNVIVQQEENLYVATCIDNGIASQGESIEVAINNLKEAIELYYEDNSLDFVPVTAYLTTLEVAI